MYQLRDYQTGASESALRFFRTGTCRGGLIVLPTGAGKSLVIADIAAKLGEPVVVFQPSKEILVQNLEKMRSYGVTNIGVFSTSMGSHNICHITFATIGSVIRHRERFSRFRYAIIDECHLVNPEEGMYKKFLDTVRCKIVGLTATPYRLYSSRYDGSMLRFITRMRNTVFPQLLYCVQVKQLEQRGYLAEMNYYQVPLIDTRKLKVNTTGNDYTDQSVRKHFKEVDFAGHLLSIVNRLLNAGRKSIIVFTRFTEEAENLVLNLGGSARVVSAKTPQNERDATLRAFKTGHVKVIANVGILTTGFDFPSLSTVVLARPTRSLSLYYQMVGRGIRPSAECPQKWCVDLCNNVKFFGKVSDLVIYNNERGLPAVYNRERQLTNVFF